MISRSFLTVLVMLYGGVGLAPVAAQPDYYRRVVSQVSIFPGLGDTYRGYGQYLIDKEEAALKHEDVRQKKLETRRLTLDHYEFERDWFAGLLNRQRKRDEDAELVRAMNNPPFTEIASGRALNIILVALKDRKDQLATIRSDPLAPDVVEQINTNFGAGGNLGLLRGGKVTWPVPLKNPAYASTCKRIDECVARIYQRLLTSQEVAFEELKDLERLTDQLNASRAEEFRKNVKDSYIFQDSSLIRRFVSQLDDAISMLRRDQTNAILYLRPVEGKTPAEVALYLINKGLRIASPTEGKGGEIKYQVLHGEFVKLLKQLDPGAGVVRPAPR